MKAILTIKQCQLFTLNRFVTKIYHKQFSLGNNFYLRQKTKEQLQQHDDIPQFKSVPFRIESDVISEKIKNLAINKTNVQTKNDETKPLIIKDSELDISLLDSSWKEIKVNWKQLPLYYTKLAKRNLTALVVITTMGGYVMAPGAFDIVTFLMVSFGTTLTSTAANSINQFLEVPYDSQMNRTKDRILVKGLLSPVHSFTFASICAVTGVGILGYFVNPLTAALGATNLVLYTAVYTPLKRLSVVNTWVGSIVGAIPPIMGYTACTGQIDAPGLLFGAILYSWQFPHFHGLSWNIRNDYSRAGYRMISILNSRVCTSSAFNHTLALTVMCSYIAPTVHLTTWNFAIDSLIPNLYFVYLAYRFKRDKDSNSSRKLFRYSLIYLPLIMLLMLVTKSQTTEAEKKNDEILKLRQALLRASLNTDLKEIK